MAATKVGQRGSGVSGVVQDYEKIKQQCLAQKKLFEDPEFAANGASINKKAPNTTFQWKRPGEICNNPQFVDAGTSRFDVKQGALGDCWLLASVANLTLHQKLLDKVVPPGQSFQKDYAGIFRFRFWRYGKWVEVVVDDRLPVQNGRLVYMRSTEDNEFWSALLEKAYAKLHGSYHALASGNTDDAMEDFTGGVCEIYDLKKNVPSDLFNIMVKGFERSSLMTGSMKADPKIKEKPMANGLRAGHAYSVTAVREITAPSIRGGKVQLIRMRNPWGNQYEYSGDYCDRSDAWKNIPEKDKKEMGLTFENDGEFWMTYEDFLKNMDTLEMCNLCPDSLGETHGKCNKKWSTEEFEGSWVKGVSAGGRPKCKDTFWKNPQYSVTLTQPDDGDKLCTMLVALMQKDRRGNGLKNHGIGYVIYQMGPAGSAPKPLPNNFFQGSKAAESTDEYKRRRENSKRVKLPPGTYCLVPTTYEKDEEGDFIIRVFSEKTSGVKEHDVDDAKLLESEEVESAPPVEFEDPSVEVGLEQLFARYAKDEEIGAHGLKQILDIALRTEFQFHGFSVEVCRSMVATMDFDLSGKLGLDEFMALWKNILAWKEVFIQHDTDNSGSLDPSELRNALTKAGFAVNLRVLTLLVRRYGSQDGNLLFDDFILFLVRLKTMLEIFKEKSDANHKATFELSEWLEKAMYC